MTVVCASNAYKTTGVSRVVGLVHDILTLSPKLVWHSVHPEARLARCTPKPGNVRTSGSENPARARPRPPPHPRPQPCSNLPPTPPHGPVGHLTGDGPSQRRLEKRMESARKPERMPALNARWDADGLNDSATTYDGDNHWQDGEENQTRPSSSQTTVILGKIGVGTTRL